jgi:DNA-directed RNA polymerase specialized sigma24 family protein
MPETTFTPRLHAAIETAAVDIERHLGRRFPAFADDIAQEARLAGLAAAHRFDEEMGTSAEAYMYRVMVLSVAPLIQRWLSVTSISRRMARLGLAGTAQRAGEPQEGDAWVLPYQETLEARREQLGRLVALRVRWRREVDAAVRGLDPQAVACGALSVGLDGERMTEGQIAQLLGIWRDDVQGAVRRFRRRLPTKTIRLEREVLAAEAAMP